MFIKNVAFYRNKLKEAGIKPSDIKTMDDVKKLPFTKKNDLKVWADLMARCFYMVGVRPGDVFQNAANYGLFTGGLGIHAGAERLGCAVVPSGTGSTQKQIENRRDFYDWHDKADIAVRGE